MTKEEIIALAREAGFKQRHNSPIEWWMYADAIERFAKRVAEHEREQCAQVCDELGNASKITYAGLGAIYCAEAIRARKENA